LTIDLSEEEDLDDR